MKEGKKFQWNSYLGLTFARVTALMSTRAINLNDVLGCRVELCQVCHQHDAQLQMDTCII